MFAAAAKNFVAPGLYIVGRRQAVEDQIERQTETLAGDPRHTNWRGSQVYQLEPCGAGALGVMPKLKNATAIDGVEIVVIEEIEYESEQVSRFHERGAAIASRLIASPRRYPGGQSVLSSAFIK